MGKNVDDRIVKMGFDNAQFERGISQSTSSLDKLKKGLNLEGASRGLENLDRVSKSFTLGGISDALTGISEKFSSLGIIGITTLQNLTNSAVNAGKNLVSALTIDPIKMGFGEYETKMGSIQTILTNTASKGTTLDDVTGALDDLNTYADKTIYNFAEMTRNIGTFTAAGVDLDTSKTAIKGIANLAAASGSNAQQASTAMYQLSQALAAGSVKLMDWNSVVNAGMGGELFKNALTATAKEMGTDVDGMIKKNGSFRESLQEGWITADVLNTTLKKMTKEGAKDYADSMVAAGKYTQEQADALMKQAAMAENAATEVKTLTQMLDTMKESVQSGWAQSWESIIGDKDQSTKTLTAINDAFGSLITPSTNARNAMLAFWNENKGRDAVIKGLSNVFHGLMSILTPIGEAFKEVFPPMTGKRLVEISKKFEELTAKFKIGKRTAEAIKTTFKGFFAVIDIGVQVVKTLANAALILLGAILPIGDGFLGASKSLGGFLVSADESIKKSGIFGTALQKLKDLLDKIPESVGGFDKVTATFEKFADSVVKVFGTVKESIWGTLGDLNFDKIFAVINGGLLAAVLLGLKSFIDGLKKVAAKGPGFVKTITDMLGGVKECMKAYQNQLNAGTLVKIATAIGILAAALFLLSTIDPAKLVSATVAMSAMFVELIGSLTLFQKFAGGMGIKAVITTIPMLIALSTAILILAAAMKVLAGLKWKQIAKGLTAITILAGILVASSKLLAKSSGQLVKSAFGFILFAGALFILAKAVKMLGELNVKQLAKGLISIGILCLELTAFMKLVGSSSMSIKSAAGILVLAAALTLLATAVRILGTMDLAQLGKGLLAIGLILGMLALFMKVQSDPKQVLAMAAAMMLMGTALILFATAVGILGSMKVTTLAKGLGALAIALFIMGVAMKGMQSGLPGAAALLVMAAGIAILAPALAILGSLKLKSIGKALLALVGVFVILGGAAVVLTPLIPALLGIGVALALLGVACLAVGTGVAALATGLTTLAASGSAWEKTLGQLIKIMANLIPVVLKKVGEGLAQLAIIIGEKAPIFIAAAMKLLMALVDAIVTNVPIFVDKGIMLVVALLNGIASRIPDMIQAGYNLVISFINGVADGLRNNTGPLILAIKNLLSALQTAAEQMFVSFAPKWMQSGVDLVLGFIKGIKSKITDAANWAGTLASKVITAAKHVLGINSPSKEFAEIGQYSGSGFVAGLKKFGGRVVTTATGMGTSAMDSLKESLSNISDIVDGNINLTPTIRPVLDMGGVTGGLSSVFDKTQSISVNSARSKASNIYATTRGSREIQNGGSNVTQHFQITVTGNQIANDYDVNRIADKLTNQMAREQRRNK